jgi:hypothetical protein
MVAREASSWSGDRPLDEQPPREGGRGKGKRKRGEVRGEEG